MNYVNVPFYKNVSNPKEFGLNCTRSLFINHNDGDDIIKLGVWHVLPKSRINDCDDNGYINERSAFEDERPIILYLHGNGGARGGDHRLKLYNVLAYSNLDAHVVAMDYRGFGDSSNVWPSADGITSDAKAVYYWLINQYRVNPNRITVWGHSLGTAVSVRFASHLPLKDIPKAVVLEAPFTSLSDVIDKHPLSIVFKKMPMFNWFIVEPLIQSEVTNFDSTSLIGKVMSPLLILHAMDDGIVPYYLGLKLYEISLKERPNTIKKTQMISFNDIHGYGHKHMHRDHEFSTIIANFINSLE